MIVVYNYEYHNLCTVYKITYHENLMFQKIYEMKC